MNNSGAARSATGRLNQPVQDERRWTDVAGAWLGIGTSPGALLIGAGLAERHSGPVPLLSILIGLALMFAILWFQGSLGLAPPYGDGGNLTEITPLYFGPFMQRVVAGLIALGMIGWFGFNVGLGGAALAKLLNTPEWTGHLLIGLPVLALSLGGLRSWNVLAALTTIAVLVLVWLVVDRYAAAIAPIRVQSDGAVWLVADVAAFIGYISVFSVRAPDFTAGMTARRDLVISSFLLCLPIAAIALAGVGLQLGTGSSDLVGILGGSGGLWIGNLLITAAVIAPTFTTLYSGAPALKASIGVPSRWGMLAITAIGLALAVTRFDLLLLPWLGVLAAMLPPLLVPLAVESTRRRTGAQPHLIPFWVWLPGAAISILLTIYRLPLAPLVGLIVSAGFTALIYLLPQRGPQDG